MGYQPDALKIWSALQGIFTVKWLERCQYLQAMAKQSRFKDAALATQEQVVAEEGKMLAMMFALLQEQHTDGCDGSGKPVGNGGNVRENECHHRQSGETGGQGKQSASGAKRREQQTAMEEQNVSARRAQTAGR
jgi:hypothetical protein